MTGDMTAQDSLRLYGRTTELADVAALLERLRSGPGGALVVAGDPGLGRSALLEHAMRGFGAGAALLVRAEPGERHLPSSGLRSLLASHAQVLGPAPRSPDGPPEPGELLDALGSRRGSGGPLLVCVDDADLWDAGSRAALGFAARRAGRLRGVGLLLTVAGRRVDSPEFAGVPAVRLRPLDDGAAGELLDELTGGSCPSAVREELLHEAAGNPALLTALADRLTASQLSGVAPLPRPLADGGVLMRVAGGRLAELAPDAGTLLLLVAAAQELAPEGPGADAALVLRAARARRSRCGRTCRRT
ncbi:ATP-binding protein [Streptomyces zhihengii]